MSGRVIVPGAVPIVGNAIINGSSSSRHAKLEASVSAMDRLTPPPVHEPYKDTEALDDLPGISYALEIFLASHMLESEEYCHKSDPEKVRLYFATGYGLIQCVKALMSFEDEDLLAAIGHTKRGNQIANEHRKPAASVAWRLAGYVTLSSTSQRIAFIKSMTPVQRHAELVYAESLFEKALLGIIYSGDWLAFIKEALNMRTLIGIYKKLGEYLDAVDAEAQAAGKGPIDRSVDEHFRSGVYLGNGMSNLILSLIPGKLQTLIEIFGYKGDRHYGLMLLYKVGGWTKGSHEPSVSKEQEGVRRSICDMSLVIFHLFLSSFTFDGIDVQMAQKIIDWNLKRYPNGVFFLLGAGQLYLMRSQPARAVHFYTKAIECQSQYRNLHHVSFWEIAIAQLSLWDIGASLDCWAVMYEEATWSKAIYAYGLAVCFWEVGADSQKEDAAKLFDKVPGLRQRIAGKSIPLEKFVARKARKFSYQGRLAVPGLELAYLFSAIAHAPRDVLVTKMLPIVEELLQRLQSFEMKPSEYENGKGYWDDYCLAKFLEGVLLRYIGYPDPDAIIDYKEQMVISQKESSTRAVVALEFVFANGPKIEFDHHLVYYAHYELGRLLACLGDHTGAFKHFELILSDKYLEVGPSGKKGKYSMESALHMKTHAAEQALRNGSSRL